MKSSHATSANGVPQESLSIVLPVRPFSPVALLLLAMVAGCNAAGANQPAFLTNAPFLHLREKTLGYHGPASDFTNLAEIRIGWFGPTNLDDPLNGDLWWAANHAVEQANASINRSTHPANRVPPSAWAFLPFRLVPRWSVNPWGTGVSQLTHMVYDQQPLALLGSVDSASTHLAEQVAAKANLPLVNPLATDKSITLAGVPWMFSCAPSDTAVASALADAIELPEKSSLALLTCTDHESRMTARELLKELARRARMPDLRLETPPGNGALTAQMRALRNLRPNVLVIVAGAEDSARILRAVRQDCQAEASMDHHSLTVYGAPAMGRARFLELAGASAEGVCFPLLACPDAADSRAATFIANFTRARGRKPDYAALLMYDSARLLTEAIERAGPNRARIREALAQCSPWLSLGGPIHFDGTGQNTVANLRMAAIRNGDIVPLPSRRTPAQTALKLQTP